MTYKTTLKKIARVCSHISAIRQLHNKQLAVPTTYMRIRVTSQLAAAIARSIIKLALMQPPESMGQMTENLNLQLHLSGLNLN